MRAMPDALCQGRRSSVPDREASLRVRLGLIGVNAAHWLGCHAVHELAARAILGHEIKNGPRLKVTWSGILLHLRPAVFAPEQYRKLRASQD